jgi:hypothetical protein
VVSAADPLRSLISVFLTGAATFLSNSSSFVLTRAEWYGSAGNRTRDLWVSSQLWLYRVINLNDKCLNAVSFGTQQSSVPCTA